MFPDSLGGKEAVKVKDLFAILKREPANWNRDLIFEVVMPDGEVKAAELKGGEPTKEEPRQFVLRVKVK
jgi:hypothetical protein